MITKMTSLFQRNGQKMNTLLRFIIFMSIWGIANSATRNAPFCIDADKTKENLIHSSERFQPIIAQQNDNNPPIPSLATPTSTLTYVHSITLTRMVVDDNILPTTFHTMRNLRNWVHVKIETEEISGLYIQAIKAPLGVPFGNFVIDFECRDCFEKHDISNAIPTAQVVPCKGRPNTASTHPDALVVAGLDVDPMFVMKHGFHFHFSWIESLCDDVPLFQFLIVAVKSFSTSDLDYQIYWSPLYENPIADTWTGVSWPLDPTWKHNGTIACHGEHHLMEEGLSVHVSTKNASGIIRVNEDYENCIRNDAMEEGYKCPPGPFACDNPPQNKNEWEIRRRMDINNALDMCIACSDGSSHVIRKREIEDQDNDSDDDDDLELDGSADELEESTGKNELGGPTGKDELEGSGEGDIPEVKSALGSKDDLGAVDSRNVHGGVGTTTEHPDEYNPEEHVSILTSRASHPSLDSNKDLDYPIERTNLGPRTGKNSVKTPDNKKSSSDFSNYFAVQTQLLLQDCVKAHSILMVLCWCTFTSISCYLARFHKEVSSITPGSGCCSLGGWLWGHTIFSYMSLGAMWAAVLLISPYMLIQPGTYGKNKTHSTVAHTVIGAIAMTFFHFNHILGWYRPLSPSMRGIYIMTHVVLGYGSKYLAVITAFKSTIPTSVLLFIILAEIFNVAIYAVATFVQCKIDKKLNFDPPRSYFPVPEGIDTYDPDYKETSSINSCLLNLQSQVLLYIHYILQFIPFIVVIVEVCEWNM